jgi:curved DNA-binding protein CbpA
VNALGPDGRRMKKVLDLNFYELLEIAFDASPFAIRQAYKEMIQLYHGDSLASYSFFSSEEREEILAKLDEAYSTLIDEKKRSQYDQLLIEQGIFEEGMRYQQDRKTLSFLSHPRGFRAHAVLRKKNELTAMGSSNSVIQEILAQDVLSGNDLKKIRNELGVSLETIADMAKVRVVFLRAIEEDQFEKTPSRIFLKSFLRAYAQCMGLDADLVASRYLKRIPE